MIWWSDFSLWIDNQETAASISKSLLSIESEQHSVGTEVLSTYDFTGFEMFEFDAQIRASI